ncbi:hypothetical protein TanjilG_17969 [Lupinus angustifolius]|uniref:Uncharacterized protein n=1 Tax=Lupinus angustifolius TaxID=3871 RepID=A0A1J7GWW3_LUPAN|nr:PREDICTED: uncharacterized protein LOC109332347 [Lupinus angustifolius]OIV92618.1 hypothetical protein TanjilG_17969 [Lupinus angustifolius]
MDFFSLSRKDLQFLSKKNKIPANQTNLAMAQSLSSLPQVEGLDEILNPVEGDLSHYQEEKVIETPNIHHSRTSTRRKDVNIAVATSAMRSISTHRKKKEGDEKPVDYVLKTPAAPTTMTRPYNTRRSARFLEKNLSKMSLMDSGDLVESVKFDDVYQQTQESVEAEQHDSNLKLEESSKTRNDSIEVKKVHEDNGTETKLLAEPQNSCDYTEPEHKRCIGDTPVEASDDASKEITNRDTLAFNSYAELPDNASMEVTDNQGGNDSGVVSEVACMEVITDHDVAALTVEVPDDASMEAINTLVDGDVNPEEIVIPKPESSISVEIMKHNTDEVSFSTMAVAPIYELKTDDIPIQSFAADQLKAESYSLAQTEPKDIADEHMKEEDKNKFYTMKENSLEDMSMGQLRKMLKNLKLDGKSYSKNNNVEKEINSKRTALQALPVNKMIADETRNDC